MTNITTSALKELRHHCVSIVAADVHMRLVAAGPRRTLVLRKSLRLHDPGYLANHALRQAFLGARDERCLVSVVRSIGKELEHRVGAQWYEGEVLDLGVLHSTASRLLR
jgi:hypothetical protein